MYRNERTTPASCHVKLPSCDKATSPKTKQKAHAHRYIWHGLFSLPPLTLSRQRFGFLQVI